MKKDQPNLVSQVQREACPVKAQSGICWTAKCHNTDC